MNAAGVSTKEFCFTEERSTCVRSIPGKSDDAVGYLRTGEKETPRRVEAHTVLVYAHITRRAMDRKRFRATSLLGEAA